MKFLLIPTFALALLATAGHAQQAVARLEPAGDAPRQAATPPVPPAAAPADNLSCQVLTGRVTDEFAYPLSGATIILRAPGKGFSLDAFSTNSEGHYIITSKQPISRNTVMEISAVGYNLLELPLTSCTPLDLTLIPLVSNHSKVKIRSKKSGGSSRGR